MTGALLARTRGRLGHFVPLCSPNGGYQKLQCGHGGFCWCVDRYGNEIPRTKVRGVPHSCTIDGKLLVSTKESDLIKF